MGKNDPAPQAFPRDEVTAGLSFCLGLAFLGVMFLLAERESQLKQGSMLLLFEAVSISLAILLFYYAVSPFIFRFSLGLRLWKERGPRAVAAGAFLASAAFLSHHVRIAPDGFGLRPILDKLHLTIFFFSLILLVTYSGCCIARRAQSSPRLSNLRSLTALGLPVALAIAAIFSWLSGARPFPLSGALRIALPIVLGLLGISLLFLLYRLGSIVKPVPWLIGMSTVIWALGVTSAASRLLPTTPRAPADPSRSPTRILLITVDSLRADFLSCYGSREVSTPNVDKVASGGVLFERASSAAPYTLPSVVSIATGLPVAVHGVRVREHSLSPAITTVAERLRQSGLNTGAVCFGLLLAPDFGISQGFQDYAWFPLGPIWAKLPFTKSLPRLFFREAAKGKPSSEKLTRMAAKWLRRNKDNSFFFWLHYKDPHAPYSPPAPFKPEGPPPPRIGFNFNHAQDWRSGHFSPTREEKEWIRKLCAAEVRYVDSCVGRLPAELQTLGIYDDTLIVISSDHGEELSDHNGYEHGHAVWEEVTHVPLIFSGKSVPKGKRILARVSNMDIGPTILGLSGIEAPQGDILGRDLLSAFSDPDARVHDLVVSEGLCYYEDRRAIRFGNMKYVRYLESGFEELYDLALDPNETRSLVSERPQELQQGRQFWEDYQRKASELSELISDRPRKTELSAEQIKELKALGYIK